MLFLFRTVVALLGVCAAKVSSKRAREFSSRMFLYQRIEVAIVNPLLQQTPFSHITKKQSTFLSVVSDLSTNSTWTPIESSISSLVAHGQTPTSGFVTAFPTEAQPVSSSIYSFETSILAVNGFETANAAMPTGRAMVGAAAGNEIYRTLVVRQTHYLQLLKR